VRPTRFWRIAVQEMLVKKYTNRRLYDTEESRYITLDELAEKIRAGADPTVVDARSGDDLTQATLAQIIMESRGAGRILPVPLLLQLIRLGDEALTEFLGHYLSLALEAYVHAKQGAQALSPYNPFATLPFSATSALARLMMGGFPEGMTMPGAFGAPFAAPNGTPPPAAPKSPRPQPGKPAETEVATLRRELDELKREVHRKRK